MLRDPETNEPRRFGSAPLGWGRLLLAVLWLGAGVVPVAAEDAPEPWTEAAGLQVIIADQIDGSTRLFDSPDYQHTLVIPEESEAAYVLELKSQSLHQIPMDAIAWTKAGLPIPDLTRSEAIGMFMNLEGDLSFDHGDQIIHVVPEPPLVGQITEAKLRESKPDYAHAALKYAPEAAALATLRKMPPNVEVKVFFGTWCSYCKHWVPHFLRLRDELAATKWTAEYYGMSEDQSEPGDVLGKYDISKTPTFVVLRDGKEVGRIEEEPIISMEADLVRILGLP